MSFNPPTTPFADETYQYGSLVWRFDATAGVWNIVDGSIVGEQGPQGPPGPQGDPGPKGNTGDPATGDSAAIVVSNGFITARLGTVGVTGVLGVSNRFSVVNGIAHPLPASNGASGIASFDSTYFSVSGTGHVSLVGSLNSGVTSFNGLTGAVTLTGDGGAIVGAGNNRIVARLVTSGTTGIASFNTTHFSVSSLTGHVSLAAAYQATGDTVITVPGSGIGISTSGRTDTLFNIGVTSFNGLTGTVTMTGDGGAVVGAANNTIRARLATASLTGVASFPATDFAVSSAGVVSVTGNFVRTVVVGGSTLTGNVSLTSGSNITLTPSGSTITIASTASGGGGAGITANAQQVLFSSGNGGTGSNNFLFDGTSATFGGANTQFTITGPSLNIGNNTVVRGGIYYDAAESAPYTDFGNSQVSIKASNGSVQRVRVNRTDTGGYTVDFDESVAGNWTGVTGVAESVVVILQSANGKTGGFASGILLPTASTVLGGVTGGIDVFTMMRIPYIGGSLKMAFPIARGMTGTAQSIGTS